MTALSKVRHDFINNGLRIEIINKMITDCLEQDKEINKEQIKDLKTFLKLHQDLIEQLMQLV